MTTDSQTPRVLDRRVPWPIVAVVVILLIGAGIWLFRPHTYSGLVIQSPSPAASLDGLVFTDGERADLARFSDKVVLMYFGYTYCPDICPTTLARIADARARMGDAGDDLQVLMVTVDPARDTADVLGEYVSHFDPAFLGVTGRVEDTDRVATLYGIYVNRHDEDGTSDYTVDHTGTLMAVDRDGFLRVVFSNDVTAADLAADLRELVG